MRKITIILNSDSDGVNVSVQGENTASTDIIERALATRLQTHLERLCKHQASLLIEDLNTSVGDERCVSVTPDDCCDSHDGNTENVPVATSVAAV